MAHLPFTVFKRSGRRFFYVKFKNEAREYLPAVSTKQTTEAAIIETAFKWFREGKPGAGSPIPLSIRQIIKGGLTVTDADFICRELKRQGFLKTYVMTGVGRRWILHRSLRISGIMKIRLMSGRS